MTDGPTRDMAAQTLQNDVLGKLRSGLDTVRNSLDVPLVFGHLCKGSLEKPGVLRVSAVIGNPAKINDCDHDTAFLRHVQRFGREKTLLHWLVCWTRAALAKHDRSNSNVVITASFLVHDDGEALVNVVMDGLGSHTTLSKKLVRCLVPEGLAKTYLDTLYAPDDDTVQPTLFCGRRLPELEMLAAQMQTLRMLKMCDVGTHNFDSLCAAYRPESNGSPLSDDAKDADRLQLLNALQIAFAYAEKFEPACLASGGFVSVCRPHDDTLKDSATPLDAVPVLAVSTTVTASSAVNELNNKLTDAARKEPLSNALQKLSDNQGAARPPGTLIGNDTKFSSASATSFVSALPTNPPYKLWSENAAQWIALLVSELQGAKHEGSPLEFTFVMGDMAQIEDSSAFKRLRLSDAGFDFPPRQTETCEAKMIASLRGAMRVIEKENYFWFQEGRYALLWDFTFPEPQPQYLLGLKDSSWHVFIANVRNRIRSATADAALVVGYLNGRGGGGLIVGENHVFSLSQQGKWIQRGADLSTRVGDYLQAAGILNDTEKETLVKVLVAVSNDPNSGCMLVLANGTACPLFETMGSPWRVSPIGKTVHQAGEDDKLTDLADGELVAMLGMDGAACVWKKDDSYRIAFRRLARPGDPGTSYKPASNVLKRLSGEGSRKWSGLLAACRTDVNLVVAVSQDGPVHFYCQAKVAKAARSELTNGAFEALFGTTLDEEVVHDRIPE